MPPGDEAHSGQQRQPQRSETFHTFDSVQISGFLAAQVWDLVCAASASNCHSMDKVTELHISVTNKISLWLFDFSPDTDLNTRSEVPAFISAYTGVTCRESPEPDRGEVVHLCWVGPSAGLCWIVGNAA